MKKWLTIGLLSLGILTTIGSCTMAYINGTATDKTAADATAKVIENARQIRETYNAPDGSSQTDPHTRGADDGAEESDA